MGSIQGVECKVYFNTATYGTPTWVEWSCARDTTLSIDYEEVDASCRGGGGYRQSAIALTSIEVSGNAIKDKADTTFVAIEAAARAKTVIDILVLDGPRLSASTDGYRMDAQIFNWTENQPFEDTVTIDFSIKPARSANAPTPVSGPLASTGDA